MRVLPIVIVLVLLGGIGYLLRNSVTGLFTGTTDKNDSQTVVLRQTATPSPSAIPVPTATPVPASTAVPVSQSPSIVNLNSSATPVPTSSNLPAAGPADSVATAAVVGAVFSGLYRFVFPRPVTKAKIDIL